jgi:hypothetical protein
MIGLLMLAREMVRGVQTPVRVGLSAPSPELNFASVPTEKFMLARAPASAREGACAPRNAGDRAQLAAQSSIQNPASSIQDGDAK